MQSVQHEELLLMQFGDQRKLPQTQKRLYRVESGLYVVARVRAFAEEGIAACSDTAAQWSPTRWPALAVTQST